MTSSMRRDRSSSVNGFWRRDALRLVPASNYAPPGQFRGDLLTCHESLRLDLGVGQEAESHLVGGGPPEAYRTVRIGVVRVGGLVIPPKREIDLGARGSEDRLGQGIRMLPVEVVGRHVQEGLFLTAR